MTTRKLNPAPFALSSVRAADAYRRACGPRASIRRAARGYSARTEVAFAAAALAAALVWAGAAAAQGLALPGADSNAPVEITASDGIEWQRDAQVYIARGNARAAQGNSAVDADTLVAHYEGGNGSSTRITRIEAEGNVRLAAPSGTATGAHGTYHVERGILVLTGSPRLDTATDRIVARESLEYWRDRSMVVARGGAVATREDTRLAANVLVGHLGKGKDGKEQIVRIDAFDNVTVTTPTDVVRAARGTYNVETGIADLRGAVKITRCNSQLSGERARVDMNPGRSELLSGPDGQVRGLIVPSNREGGRDACPDPRK